MQSLQLRPQRGAFALAFLFAVARLGAQTPSFDLGVVAFTPDLNPKALVDFDGDGVKDVLSVALSTSPAAATLKGLRNDGTAHFATTWTSVLPTGGFPYRAIAKPAHLDAGTAEDFVLAVDAVLGWFASNGAGSAPTFYGYVIMPGVVQDLAVADLNGDGLDDVVVLSTTNLRVYLTQPGLGAPTLASDVPLATTPYFGALLFGSVCIAPLVGGPAPDVVVAHATSGSLIPNAEVLIYPNTAGVLGAPVNVPIPPTRCVGVAAADFEGDGVLDVFVGGLGLGFSHFLHGNVDGTFTALPVTLDASCDAVVDYDGDGDLDVVGGNPSSNSAGSDVTPNHVGGYCRVALNDGGTFGGPVATPFIGGSRVAGVADLDGDGALDLLIGRTLMLRRGASLSAPPPYSSVNLGSAAADLDGDGDRELAVRFYGPNGQNSTAGTLAYARNDGAGGNSSVLVPGPAAPNNWFWRESRIVGDFDGDGLEDVLGIRVSLQNFRAMPEVLHNNGNGTLTPNGPSPSTDIFELPFGNGGTFDASSGGVLSDENALVRDVDGDGDLDLVVSGYDGSFGGVLRCRPAFNDGAGHFTAGPASELWARNCGDFDGDGYVDLLGVAYVGGAFLLRALWGGPGGTFGAGAAGATDIGTLPTYFSTNGFQNRFGAGDIGGDGDWDFVYSTANEHRFVENLGGRVFGTTTIAQIEIPGFASAYQRKAFIGDFDGDGMNDAVVSPIAFALTVPSNNSAEFSGAALIAGGPPTRIYPAQFDGFFDIDGDGDLDGSIGTAVARSNRYFGAAAGKRLQFGAGTTGTGGFSPLLGCTGPTRVGTTPSLRIGGGLGGSFGFMAIDTVSANVPFAGGTLLTTPNVVVPFSLGGPAGVAGLGSLSLPFAVPVGIDGVTFYSQVAIADPAGVAGVALSQGLQLTFGG